MNLKNKKYLQLILIYGAFVAPLIVLFSNSFSPTKDIESWLFIKEQLVPTLLKNTLFLTLFTTLGSLSIALFLGVILELTDIPRKKLISILSLTPLAFPLYITSYIYVGAFEWSSPLMQFFREYGFSTIGNLKIKSLSAIVFVFSFSLYPYLLLPIRRTLSQLKGTLFYSALTLRKSKFQVLRKLILPILKRPIYIGVGFICMEVLADFGGVSVFNYDTFSTAIYTSWSGLFSYQIACRLSLILLSFSTTFFLIEYLFLNKETQLINSKQIASPVRLNIYSKISFLIIVFIIFIFSFIFPLIQLLYWVLSSVKLENILETYPLIINSIYLGIIISIIAISFSVFLLFIERSIKRDHPLKILLFLGYALPGNIIAISMFFSFKTVIASWGRYGLYVALGSGLFYRFISIPLRFIGQEAKKIPDSFESVAKSLKVSTLPFFSKIWFPTLKKTTLFSLLFLILEVCKEMPITLMLRPVGANYVSTKIYELTSEGEWIDASLPSLYLVLITAFITFIMHRRENDY